MKNDIIFKCRTCGIEKSKRDTKKINNQRICKSCLKKRRYKHREFIKRDVLGIRKRGDLLKEWKEKREIKKAEKEVIKQAIKEERERKKRNKSVTLKRLPRQKIKIYSYLSLEEKQLLFKKYYKQGDDIE
ncbi:hypothetical protein LCGC14_1747250, partial [marine sediment metagenome]